MPEEKLTTKLELSGEKEYRAALKAITSEQKANRSEMNLLKAQYEGNLNSAEALRAKLAVLEKQYESQQKKVDVLKTGMTDAAKRQEEYTEKAEAARKALDELEKSGTATNAELEKQKQVLAENVRYQMEAEKTVNGYRTQLNNAEAALLELDRELERNRGYLDEAENSADGCARSIDGYGKEVKEAGDESSVFADVLAANVVDKGLSKVMEYAKKAGEALIGLAEDSDRARSTIAEMTGATGDDLEDMHAVMLDVYGELPFEMDYIAEVVGEVNTRLGSTGDVLRDQSSKIADWGDMLHVGGSEAVDLAADVMAQWEVSSDRLDDVLDRLLWASQYSGEGVQEFASTLASSRAQLELYGYDLDSSTALLAEMAKEGISASTVLTALRTGTDKLTEGGRNAKDALAEEMEVIKGFRTESEAAAYASDLFGARAGTAFASAIRRGKLDVESLTETVAGAGGTLERTAEASDTMQERWTTALNKMRADMAPFAEELYGLGLDILPTVQGALEFVGEHLSGVASTLTGVTAAVVAYKAAVSLATVANSAFGASLNATGIGLVVSAVAGLTVGLGTLIATADSASDRASELADELEEVKKASEETGRALEDTLGKTFGAADAAEQYIRKLEELEEQGLDTAEAQAEHDEAVRMLEELIPDLNIKLDENTGRIEGGTQAIRDQIAAWKELAVVEALKTAASEYYTQLAQYATTAAEAERGVREELGMTMEEAQAGILFNRMSGWKSTGPLADYVDTYNEATAAMERCSTAAHGIEAALPRISDAISRGEEIDLAGLVSAIAGGIESIPEETEGASSAAGKEIAGDVAAGVTDGAPEVADAAKGAVAEAADEAEDEALTAGERVAKAWTDGMSALGEITAGVDKLAAALEEQAEAGSLSTDTILELTKAGYAAALSVDRETGAVTVDADAFRALAAARIEAQLAAEEQSAAEARERQMAYERAAATELANANIDLGLSYLAVAEARGEEAAGHEAAAARLRALKESLENGGGTGTGSGTGGGSSGGGGKKSSSKEETDEDRYSAAKKVLDFRRDMDELTDEDYYRQLEELVGKYLTKGTDKWMSETSSLYKARKKLREQAAKDEAAATKAEYSERLADLKYYRELGIITEDEYYSRLRDLRDTYLERDSAEWRSHTKEIYNYLTGESEKLIEEMRTAQEEREAALGEAVQSSVDARKKAIESERDAFLAAIDDEISGIEALIDARKREREDAEAEDELEAKRRAVAAAERELEYARTDEDRLELTRELERLRDELADAEAGREFELWERAQRDRIDELKSEQDAIKESAESSTAALDAELERYDRAAERREQAYGDYLSGLSARMAGEIRAAMEIGGAGGGVTNNYTTTNSSPSANLTVNTPSVTVGMIEEIMRRLLEDIDR